MSDKCFSAGFAAAVNTSSNCSGISNAMTLKTNVLSGMERRDARKGLSRWYEQNTSFRRDISSICDRLCSDGMIEAREVSIYASAIRYDIA